MIKSKVMVILLIVGLLTPIFQQSKVLAATVNLDVIPYVQNNGVDVVNIVDLANSMKVSVKKVSDGIEMYLNYKKVTIYDNDSYIYVDGSAVPLKTTKVKTDDGTYYLPVYATPTKDGDGYLIPKSIIEKYIGITCAEDGIHITATDEPDSTAKSSSDSIIFSTDGQNGWVKKDDGKFYYLDNGSIQYGWHKDGNDYYWLGNDGSMKTGWVQANGKWYYLYNNGKLAINTTINGYYVDNTGAWVSSGGSSGSSTSSSTSSSTGISYAELNNRVESLGYTEKKYCPAGYGFTAGYGYFWKYNSYGSISVYEDMFSIQLKANDAEYHQANKQIFNWLLPTQGDYLDSILCSNLTNQTLTLDGKTVTIKVYEDAIGVTIKG